MLLCVPKPSWSALQPCLVRAHWSRQQMPERCASLMASRQWNSCKYCSERPDSTTATYIGTSRYGVDKHRLIGRHSSIIPTPKRPPHTDASIRQRQKGPSPPRRCGGTPKAVRTPGVDEKVENTQQVSRCRRKGGRGWTEARAAGGGGNWTQPSMAASIKGATISTWPCASSAAARRIARAAAGAGARRTGRPGRRPGG